MALRISLTRRHPKTSFAEENQQYANEFAYVQKEDNVVYLLHKPVKCRDFLLDTLVWQAHPKMFPEGTEIYGYGFNGPVNPDRLELVIDKCTPREVSLPDLFNKFEKENNLPLTQFEPIGRTKKQWYFVVPQFWTTSTARLSLYTALMRLVEGVGEVEPNKIEASLSWSRLCAPLWAYQPDYKKLKNLLAAVLALPLPTIGRHICDITRGVDSVHANSGFVAALYPKFRNFTIYREGAI